jgi:alkanesulfonate monooxygenase SsuD/methylene tetrahydromethanopterin reductase-like flavin-dependent oxidoreductase (luciferase family)
VPVEIIGMIGVKPEGADGAAVHVIGAAIDTQWLRAFAQAHEKSGFDRVLVGYTSTSAEGFAVTGYAAAHTERLSYLIAHRPGFVAPTLTARAAATLDHVTSGRVALHITALVGTPEQVAESLLDYYDIGCTTLAIRGFDPLNDALEYGHELIPRVRAEVARRDRHHLDPGRPQPV